MSTSTNTNTSTSTTTPPGLCPDCRLPLHHALADGYTVGLCECERGREKNQMYYTPETLPADAGYVVGVEVPAGHPVLDQCDANLDPQHGGGVYGFDEVVDTSGCAAKVAYRLVRAGECAPANTVFVSPRWDLDAAVATLLLQHHIEPDELDRELLERLDRLDNPKRLPNTWGPRVRVNPVAVGDDPCLGGLTALLMAATGMGHRTPEGVPELALDEAMNIVERFFITLGFSSRKAEVANNACQRARKDAAAIVHERLTTAGLVAVVEDCPVPAGAYAYASRPVAVVSNDGFRFRDGTIGRKYTVMAHPGAPSGCYQAVRAAEARLRELEDGWGGPPGMVASPFDRPSQLEMQTVVQAVSDALDQHVPAEVVPHCCMPPQHAGPCACGSGQPQETCTERGPA